MKIPEKVPISLLESALLGIKESRGGNSPKESRPPQAAPMESVEISKKAKDIQQLNQLISSLPEIRSDRVAEIQKKIEAGTYNVQGKQVAEQMVRSTLLDAIL